MLDKETRKRIKKIRKEINRLKKEYKKVEVIPCRNDADLKKKDDKLKALMERIYAMEKEIDRFVLDSGRVEHTIIR